MARRGNFRGSGARGNVDPVVIEMLRGITARLKAIEMDQRRGRHVEDVSDAEEEEVASEELGVNPPTNDLDNERFIKSLTRVNTTQYHTTL